MPSMRPLWDMLLAVRDGDSERRQYLTVLKQKSQDHGLGLSRREVVAMEPAAAE